MSTGVSLQVESQFQQRCPAILVNALTVLGLLDLCRLRMRLICQAFAGCEEGTQPVEGRTFSMLAARDKSSYLAMKVFTNQVLNQAPTGPSAFTNGGIMAYTGPCRNKLWFWVWQSGR